MALTESGKLDITAIVGGAWDDIWRAWKPGGLLILVMVLGFVPLFAVAVAVAPAPKHIPSAGAIIGLIGGFLLGLIVVSYAYIMMMRIFMLGRSRFLQISPATATLYLLRCLWKGIQLMIVILPLDALFFGPIAGLVTYVMRARIAGTPVAAGPAVILTLSTMAWAFLGIVIVTIITVRVFPVFYSIVVGGHLRFRDAWRGMSGHTWRGFVCLFLVYLGNLAISMGVWFATSMLSAIVGGAVVTAGAGALTTTSAITLGIINLLVMLPVYYISFTWTAATKTRIFKEIWPPDAGLTED